MTNSEEKPDGWVAWHPMCGCVYETMAVKREETIGNMYVLQGKNWMEDPVLSVLPLESWRIRPVKLQFLDEDPK